MIGDYWHFFIICDYWWKLWYIGDYWWLKDRRGESGGIMPQMMIF